MSTQNKKLSQILVLVSKLKLTISMSNYGQDLIQA